MGIGPTRSFSGLAVHVTRLPFEQFPDKDYVEPATLPKDVPQLPELGVTSAPLKSAAFFLGAFCKEYNGVYQCIRSSLVKCSMCKVSDDFMLCKAENRDPAHCLTEGRRVTRCGQDLYVLVIAPGSGLILLLRLTLRAPL